VRFQHAFRTEPSDVVLHTRLLDSTNALQQEAVGRLGVNFLHGALNLWRDPKKLVEVLLDEVGRDRLEIDWIGVRGPAFAGVDNRLLGLHLVRSGFTPALLFDTTGTPLLASEAIRHTRVLVERGRFAPVTKLNLEMMRLAGEAFAADAEGDPGEVRELMEITMNNLRDRGQTDDADFLARVDLLAAAGMLVLVSDLGAFHDLGEYLAAMSDARRARELRAVPNLLEMNAAELLQEIQRIDRKRGALQQRQQGVESRQTALVDRAAANRQASADAARATAERLRAAPAQAPAGQGGGKPPFSDVPQRQMSIGVGPMGAFISM